MFQFLSIEFVNLFIMKLAQEPQNLVETIETFLKILAKCRMCFHEVEYFRERIFP